MPWCITALLWYSDAEVIWGWNQLVQVYHEESPEEDWGWQGQAVQEEEDGYAEVDPILKFRFNNLSKDPWVNPTNQWGLYFGLNL